MPPVCGAPGRPALLMLPFWLASRDFSATGTDVRADIQCARLDEARREADPGVIGADAAHIPDRADSKAVAVGIVQLRARIRPRQRRYIIPRRGSD